MSRITSFFLSSLPFFITITACGDFGTLGQGSDNHESKQEKSLIFTGTDVTFSSSQLYRLDYDANQMDTATMSGAMLSGSGDMALFESKNRLFIFNRRADDLNFRQLTVQSTNSGQKWLLGKQIRTPEALAGDPHAVLVLDDETFMLANYVKGILAVVNYRTGKLVQILKPKDAKTFRPAALIGLNDGRVAVLHQGYDERYELDDSQAVYVFEKEPGNTKWKLTSPSGVISLKVNVPDGLYEHSSGSLIVVGLCPSSQPSCKSGVEEIDVEDRKTSLLMEFDHSKMSYFGRPVQAGSEEFLMSIEFSPKKASHIRLSLIDYAAKKVETLFRFPPLATSGYWGNIVDHSNRIAFFGDAGKSGKGTLRAVDLGTKLMKLEIPTKLIPYSMVVVSPKEIIE